MSKPTKVNLKQFKRSLTDQDLQTAKDLYMGFESVSEIARILNVNRTTLQYYVKKSWKAERDMLSSEFISSITSSRAADLASIQGSAIKTLKRCFLNLANRPEPPSTKEATDAMKILENMDRLAKASPDEYPGFEGLNDQDVPELEVVDPFAAINKKDSDDQVS